MGNAGDGWHRPCYQVSFKMFTDAQLAQYEAQGAVTINSPVTTEQLDSAEAAWDRLKARGCDTPYEDPGYVEITQHPYFEQVAKKLLRTDVVYLWWGMEPHERAPTKLPYPPSRTQWTRECHVDIQTALDNFEAPPPPYAARAES